MQNASSRRSVALDAGFTLLVALGILMVLLGIALDYLPYTDPGLGLPQLLLIATGLLLAVMAFGLRRADVRRRTLEYMRKHLLAGLVISMITLIVLELILSAVGISTYFPPYIPQDPLEARPWWTCDEIGCRYVYEAVVAACEQGELTGRGCMINRQGFHDTQDFVAGADFDERSRILMLGDSFTFGHKAEIGKSYVETIKFNFPQSVIWNMGIPSTGTNQALALFQAYAPILQPHLVILGFVTNDFADNMYPMDIGLLGFQGKEFFIRRHQDIRGREDAIELDSPTIYYHLHGIEPPANEIERLIGITRLGTLALEMIDIVERNIFKEGPLDIQVDVDVTREYLIALRDAAAAQDTTLLVLLIPHQDSLRDTRSWAYGKNQTAIQLVEELEIPYINPRRLLDDTDYAPRPNGHWNNAGHQKIGVILSNCIKIFQISQDLSDCKQVKMP